MRSTSRYVALLAASALVLAACGEEDAPEDAVEPADTAEEPAEEPEEEPEEEPAGEEPAEDDADANAEAASLDCNTIEMIVPNAPGGGSDQQIRRLEPFMGDYFDTNVNVVYREGAGGALGWDSMMDAPADGCTIANVVNPNIIIAAMEDGSSFAADDFTYIAWTEVAPTALIVPNEAPWETLEDFVEDARENPGSITVGGNGAPGEAIGGQMMEAADIDLTYVPLDDGIGGTVPLLLGGHVDAAITHSSHATTNSDTVRALGLGGQERVDAIGDVPTFHELGYEGVTILTAQGILAPPDLPDDISQIWQDAIAAAMDENEEAIAEVGLNRMDLYGEDALAFIRENMEAFGVS